MLSGFFQMIRRRNDKIFIPANIMHKVILMYIRFLADNVMVHAVRVCKILMHQRRRRYIINDFTIGSFNETSCLIYFKHNILKVLFHTAKCFHAAEHKTNNLFLCLPHFHNFYLFRQKKIRQICISFEPLNHHRLNILVCHYYYTHASTSNVDDTHSY